MAPARRGELAHYAKDAYDIEYLFPMGWRELEGVHNRTDYDLGRHSQYSGKDMQYIDQENNAERYIPYIIETSAGLTRTMLMILCDAYDEEQVASEKNAGSSEGTARGTEGSIASSGSGDDWRTVMRFHPTLAPVTVAVLPLMKKDGLAELSQEIRQELKEDFATDYDQSGAIGRRYRRQDEAGTPFCVTVDYESKDNGTVTLRFRDSMEQIRIHRTELAERLRKEIREYKRTK